jgi:hypothetical protein
MCLDPRRGNGLTCSVGSAGEKDLMKAGLQFQQLLQSGNGILIDLNIQLFQRCVLRRTQTGISV